MNRKYSAVGLAAAIATLLAGCGGSSGGSSGGSNATAPISSTTTLTPTTPTMPTTITAPITPVASTKSFPLQQAYNRRLASGYEETYAVTTVGNPGGECVGTARLVGTPATVRTTFEGLPAFSQLQTATIHFTNCTPADSVDEGIAYFNTSNYAFIGSVVANGYAYNVGTAPLPLAIQVGASGVYTTLVVVPSADQKVTITGRRDIDYVVEADTTADTAIVNLITRIYSFTSATPRYTEQSRYRIDTAGNFTPVSGDLVYSNGLRLVLTR